MTLVREYIEAIARLHMTVRQTFVDSLASWDEVITKAIDLWEAQFSEGHIGLVAARISDDGKPTDLTDIFTEFIDRRKFLQEHSSLGTNLANHFVTGKVS